ncbi:hypothetical protein [Rathayibacter sp. VKM Ac-2754]|uniref:hypothetical protein n=1 Tax=Rathayibacter sp. VKM Ac-2754 TaxID=2609251 RepID=UPI001359966F|nr:hypothetical protein [Rathayibacter sp. VKM Ac-2754]MWV58184.1 hypothetical protein [Rathayibacter sp. VKM Ac-2754]
MPEPAGGERRAFLRRSFAEAASAAIEAVGRSAPPTPRESAAAAALAGIDHVVVVAFAGRPRHQVFGALDGEDGVEFEGDTDEVMTAPALDDGVGRFAPEMLPVHTLLARSFARVEHWWADGADPLPGLLRAAHDSATPWALVVDDRQGLSTTLLEAQDHRASGSLVPLSRLAPLATAGELPPVVVVEPRSLVAPADFSSAAELGEPRSADARAAEDLLHSVYSAVRAGERAGRRMLLLVVSRGSRSRPGEVPALVIASGVRPGAGIDAPVTASTLPRLLRARFAGDRRALSDGGVLALAEAIAGPLRPLSRWPQTASAFVPPSTDRVTPRLASALLRHTEGATAETAQSALALLRAARPDASLHSDQARIPGSREGRDA